MITLGPYSVDGGKVVVRSLGYRRWGDGALALDQYAAVLKCGSGVLTECQSSDTWVLRASEAMGLG